MRISRQQKFWIAWGGSALMIAMLALAYFFGSYPVHEPRECLEEWG